VAAWPVCDNESRGESNAESLEHLCGLHRCTGPKSHGRGPKNILKSNCVGPELRYGARHTQPYRQLCP
jgi:hypothetical protein